MVTFSYNTLLQVYRYIYREVTEKRKRNKKKPQNPQYGITFKPMIADAQIISPILSALEETKKLFKWAIGARTMFTSCILQFSQRSSYLFPLLFWNSVSPDFKN